MKEIQLEQGIYIAIGENAKENWALIDASEAEWWWFHLKSFHSCHVILESEEPTKEMIIKAASLCKLYTKYRNIPNLKINYTPIKNIKKAEKVGSVTFNSNRKVLDIKI